MKLKKVLSATLATMMVMSSAMTVCASCYDSSSSSSENSTTEPEDVQVTNLLHTANPFNWLRQRNI